jgi:ASC-1-like (ASCH) protein
MRPSENPEAKTIYLKHDFLEMIQSGRKVLELRVGFPDFQRLHENDEVVFRSNSHSSHVRIVAKRTYTEFEDVLEKEDVSKLAPGLSLDTIHQLAKKLFKPEEVDKYGLLVLEFELLS